MEKNLFISVLLDYYGPVLTDKQREVVEYYYNEDLSLAEIAEHAGISRQGVRDAIKRGEATLLEMEQKLGFAAKNSRVADGLEKIRALIDHIEKVNDTRFFSREISVDAREIRKVLTGLGDE